MTSLPLVLVTGAAGKTGRATVEALTEHHRHTVRVRAMVRRDDDRARALRDLGAEVVLGDLADIRDIRRSMAGVQRAHFVTPITNASLDHSVSFAIAATECGVEHVVAVGQWLSSASHPSAMTRRTWMLDQLLAWMPGVDHTIINVGFFADNLMSAMGVAAQLGVLPLPLGDSSTAFISNEDIGRVIAGVLANPAPYVGRTLRPTGPAALTPVDVARVFSEVLGRHVRYADASERMALKTFRALGRSPFEQAQIVHYLREFRRGSFAFGPTTDVVEQVTGRRAEDLQTIARRYAAADPMARRSLPNLVRALARTVRIVLTPKLDLDAWQRAAGVPIVDGVDCADAPEWAADHDVPHAFGTKTTRPLTVAN